MSLGKRSRPEPAALFLQNPDDPTGVYPPLAELKEYSNSVHLELKELFARLSPEEWIKRHNAMTDEDFTKDPTRNRLSVLLKRTGHIASHLGQLALAKPGN